MQLILPLLAIRRRVSGLIPICCAFSSVERYLGIDGNRLSSSSATICLISSGVITKSIFVETKKMVEKIKKGNLKIQKDVD